MTATESTLGVVAKLRDEAALMEHGIAPRDTSKLLRLAADDLDRTRYHLALVLCEYTDIAAEALPFHVKNALTYYNTHNPDAQVTND